MSMPIEGVSIRKLFIDIRLSVMVASRRRCRLDVVTIAAIDDNNRFQVTMVAVRKFALENAYTITSMAKLK